MKSTYRTRVHVTDSAIKVAIVVSLSARSGISRAVSTFVHHFRDKALLVAMGDRLYQNFYEEFPEDTQVFMNPTPKLKVLTYPVTAMSIWLLSLLKRVNVVNSHGVIEAVSSSLAKLLSLGKFKNVWFIYDKYDVDIVNQGKRLKLITRAFMRVNAIDLILVLDNRVKKYVMENLGTKKVDVIRIGIHPNMIDYSNVDCENIIDLLSKRKRSKKIFFHGILIPRRRLEDLIVALSEVKRTISEELTLYVSGSLIFNTTYVSYVKRLIERLRLVENVVFLGELSDAELACMYRHTDIFVWPCDEQTWGIAPLEAMFFGKPAIVSEGTGVSEVLEDHVSILIPPKNPRALADALITLIGEKDLRDFFGNNAREFVVDNFTYENTGKRLESIFSKLIKA